jgi:hypothetical protein
MRKSILLILTILLGVSLVFSFGYNTWGRNWNEPSSNEETEINSYSLKIKEIDTSRPLAIAEDNNGKEYVINFGFLLNKYNAIPVQIGQDIKVEGQINQNFFSTDVIFAEKATIKDETYFIDYNNSNYYGGCGFGAGYNRNGIFGRTNGYGHGMMNW